MQQGIQVRFVPKIAHGDPHHPSCENGYVTAIGERFISVSFPNQYLADQCLPEELIPIEGI
jgi:hypothetical protein